MDTPTTDNTQFLKEQLNKSPDDSKKWRMAKIGLIGIAGFFLVGVVIFFVRPATAGSMVVLVQTALGAWTGIVMLYLGAQGSVDFKTTQALANSVEKKDETRTEHIIKEEHIYHEGEPGSPAEKPWGGTEGFAEV